MTLPHFPWRTALRTASRVFSGEFEKDIESVYRLGLMPAARSAPFLLPVPVHRSNFPRQGRRRTQDWSAVDVVALAEDADDLSVQSVRYPRTADTAVTVYLALVAQEQNEDMKRVSGWPLSYSPELLSERHTG